MTGGCSGTTYCPVSSTTREQMAVFVLVAKEGAGYVPPACTTPVFNDVPASSPFCRWIEELARRGVVGGCGGANYCPSSSVIREQMAVFVLRTLEPTLSPSACGAPITTTFRQAAPSAVDRGADSAWRGQGCGGGNYCPTAAVTREQMGVFISATFGLTLYGRNQVGGNVGAARAMPSLPPTPPTGRRPAGRPPPSRPSIRRNRYPSAMTVRPPEEARVPVAGREVGVSVHGEGETAVVLAHGAGGNRKTPFLVTIAEGLAAAGHRVVLTNFPYTEDKCRAPDPPRCSRSTVDAVATYAEGHAARAPRRPRRQVDGRAAGLHWWRRAAGGRPRVPRLPVAHPRPSSRCGDAHLARIAPPMLFIQGTRDALARWDLMEAVAARLPRATLHRVEDGDHSFRVLKRTGRTPAEVEAAIVSVIVSWLARLQ